MRVLILSCNTGEGHNAAGRAMVEQIEREGSQAVMLDMMSLAGERTSKIVGGTYVKIAKDFPRVFGAAYHVAMIISSDKRKSPVYYANALMAKRLKNYLERERFDAILTPHLYPAETLTHLKRQGIDLPPVVAIGTDYTCIPFWEETECDRYVIPHRDLADEYVKRGVPREKIAPLGIPVSGSFSISGNREEERRRRKLPESAPLYLVMSGSMGFGKLQVFVHLLARQLTDGEQIIVICGNNKKLRSVLQRQFLDNPSVHILGFTSHVAEYMDLSDVIFTKPGGLTSTEAAVKKIPIIHTRPIPGCETENLRFFEKRGMSFASSSMSEQIAMGKKLAEDAGLKEKMRKAQGEQMNPDAARQIYELLLSLTQCGRL